MRPHWGICPATSCTRQQPDRLHPECTARSHTATQEGSKECEPTVAAGERANRIAKWGSHMVVGTNWWEVMWAQWADHWEQSNLGVGVVGLFAMATKVGGVVSLTLG